ncbi:MAG: hypothetical protein HUU48_06490 [Flavobacteriales bacterium]|nr:hypothetical protein [Flavobacteriales bacterium]
MQYRQIYNLKRFIKASTIILPCFIFLFGIAHAQEPLKKESRKKIIHQIKKEKEAYYSNTVFNCSVQQLKEGIQKYFENRKGFSYNYDTYNSVCYTTYYTRRVREYVVCGNNTNPNEPALCLLRGSDNLRYFLYIDIVKEGDSLLKVEVDEMGDRMELYRSGTTISNFKYWNLIHFLNRYIYSKWQPAQELQTKIDRYNDSTLRTKRKITEGKDY